MKVRVGIEFRFRFKFRFKWLSLPFKTYLRLDTAADTTLNAGHHEHAIAAVNRCWEPMTRLGKAAGVSDPADASMPPDAKARVLSMVAEPEHIGCEHLRAMVMHPMEYSCRGALVQYAITAFYDLMLNGPPAIQKRLLFHVSEGYHEERGIINVYAINGFCPTYTPLVVPSVDEENNPSQYFVNHPSAVAIYRQELADFLTDRVGRQLEGRPLLPVMNEVGQGHMDRTMENLVKGKPSFAAFFTATPL